ncbi:MAG: Hint domain-containing protein, partial [Myxococcota bacterium]
MHRLVATLLLPLGLALPEPTNASALERVEAKPRVRAFSPSTSTRIGGERGLMVRQHRTDLAVDTTLASGVRDFTSPDPFVQAPFSSQSLNRYSYVFNNPLNATDPTGFESEDDGTPVEEIVVWGTPTFRRAVATPAYYPEYWMDMAAAGLNAGGGLALAALSAPAELGRAADPTGALNFALFMATLGTAEAGPAIANALQAARGGTPLMSRVSSMLGRIFGCFPDGTTVATPNGNVSIEDLRVGDYVWSYDERTDQIVAARVSAVTHRV